jgi:hypothetical protein
MKKYFLQPNNDEFKRNGPKRYVTGNPMKWTSESSLGISKDSKNIVYKVLHLEKKINSKFYIIPINGGTPTEIKETKDLVKTKYFPWEVPCL